jgi:starvation-inducible outer membrane lipoprotein
VKELDTRLTERRFTMRTIGVFTSCALYIFLYVLLGACTTKPLFSPEVMKDVETDNFNVKAWQEQAYHPSSASFGTHKVALGGEIMRVIPKSEGVELLVVEESVKQYQAYRPTNVQREDSFWYVIDFNGSPEPDMLQRGNKLVVVGTTDRASTEIISGAQKVLPHLLAQCLHIWRIKELETNEFPNGDTGYYPRKEQTFCLEKTKGISLFPSGAQGDEQKGSALEKVQSYIWEIP